MTIAHSFVAALGRSSAGTARLVGDRVAVAVAQAVGADGVGLAAAGKAWSAVPVGASNAAAALVEQLEFTVGQGPCIDAHRDGRPLIASGEVLHRRWPILGDLLMEQTSFRSAVALPLPGPLASIITVGVLFNDAQAAHHADAPGIGSLGKLVTAALIEADLQDQDDAAADGANRPVGAGADLGRREGPVWLSGPRAAQRHQVMVAAGMISWQLKVPVGDAIMVLKGRAYAQNSTADDLAAAITAGAVPVTALHNNH